MIKQTYYQKESFVDVVQYYPIELPNGEIINLDITQLKDSVTNYWTRYKEKYGLNDPIDMEQYNCNYIQHNIVMIKKYANEVFDWDSGLFFQIKHEINV